MDKHKKLVLEELALNDAQELLDILKKTPVIEQPEVSMQFVLKLSKQLRFEKHTEVERIKKVSNQKST